MMAVQWIGATDGILPAASAIGPSSPYFRFLPRGVTGPSSPLFAQLPDSGLVGAASAYPRVQALSGPQLQALEAMNGPLVPGRVAGETLSTVGRAASRMTPSAVGAASEYPSLLSAGAQAARMSPSAVGPTSSLVPTLESVGARAAAMTPSAVGPASLLSEAPAVAEAVAARSGLMGAAQTAGRGILANGWRGALLPAGIGIAGSVGGNMLDESNWLGGSESAANDTVSKMLKWGGTGAGIGLMVGGPMGAAIGAGAGGLIGAGQEWMERQGILKAPTIQEQVDTTIHDADKAAREIGMPSEVTDALKQQYRAQQAFVDPSDKTSRVALAQEYAARVQEQATAFAADPNSFLKSTTTNADPAKRAMLMRSLLVNTIKPYADNYLAQSEATAQSLENMAAGAGDLAPMYQQQAASTRQMGSMYAANLVNQAQVTPYMQALSDQASYLNQMSSNLVSQAMGQVGQTQPAAGSTDLTAIIDANTNQLQPQ